MREQLQHDDARCVQASSAPVGASETSGLLHRHISYRIKPDADDHHSITLATQLRMLGRRKPYHWRSNRCHGDYSDVSLDMSG